MKKGAPWNVQKKRDGDREVREMGKETEIEREGNMERVRERERKKGDRERMRGKEEDTEFPPCQIKSLYM